MAHEGGRQLRLGRSWQYYSDETVSGGGSRGGGWWLASVVFAQVLEDLTHCLAVCLVVVADLLHQMEVG